MQTTRIALAAWAALGLCGAPPRYAAAQEIPQTGPTWSGPAGTEASDWTTLEAESLATGRSWTSRPHFKGWYADEPSGGAMLGGSDGVIPADNKPATGIMTVKSAGDHVLWVRILYSGKHVGAFSIQIRQNGETLAEKTIDTGDEAIVREKIRGMHFEWVPIPVKLQPGSITLTVTRPADSSSRLGRNIDLFFLTDLPKYQPAITDFRPQLYVRWTNTGTGEPYCLWTYVHRNRDPWFANPGMLGLNGFNKKYGVGDPKRWIGPGQSSPWANISPYLLPDGRFNRVQFVATRKSHVEGFVTGPIQGKLEFALGPGGTPLRSIDIRQDAPRIWAGLPGDLSKPEAQVQSAYDFLDKEEAALGPGVKTPNPARYLDLVTYMELQPGMDDPALLAREMNVLKRMGFNGTYYALGPANQVADFNRTHGLTNRYGIGGGNWFLTEDRDFTRPQLEQMEAKTKAVAATYAPILKDIVRQKVVDEPSGPSMATLLASPTAAGKFREYLQQHKLSPQDVGVASWDQAHLADEKAKEAQPALFYYSQLFRLELAAQQARNVVSIKRQYLPDNVLTHANYSPPESWVQRGVDPFLAQRNGGFEMGWSEDWLGFSAGPQYTSDTYALLRSAGQGQPLGGYMVGASGGPVLQRIKYYTMIAGGARQVAVYKYGPAYADIDSWSEKYDLYPVIRDVQSELSSIDSALNGTARRKSDIAILYNRTASIWTGDDSSCEQDARFIRWALSHAGYDADIIPEEDIVAGKLNGYKVLYMDGIQLRNDAATKIAAWVRAGGTLCGGTGTGTRDELNRPTPVLELVFGAKSLNLKSVYPAGRPKFEIRGMRPLGTVTSGSVQFGQFCMGEALEPFAGATVLFKDAVGKPMGIQNRAGQGTAIRLAFLPGLAYINTATKSETYNANAYLPKDYSTAQRDFIGLPARLGNAAPVATSNLLSGEIVRYDGPNRAVIFITNYTGEVRPDFSMLVPNAAWVKRARCADGAAVEMKPEAGGLRISFPLNIAGAIVLEGNG